MENTLQVSAYMRRSDQMYPNRSRNQRETILITIILKGHSAYIRKARKTYPNSEYFFGYVSKEMSS